LVQYLLLASEIVIHKNQKIMESPQTNLSPEEREKIMLVLEQLFDASDMAFYQQELWELLKAAMSVETLYRPKKGLQFLE
jgi:hypothetical protein